MSSSAFGFAPGAAEIVSYDAATRRLFGIVLAAIPLGAGFLMILFSERRRGLHDRIARTEVILVDRRGNPESAELRAEAHVDDVGAGAAGDRFALPRVTGGALSRCAWRGPRSGRPGSPR